MITLYLDWADVPKVLQIAAGEDGTHEENGQNDGTCAKYQRAIGGQEAVDGHFSWCLYFVLWCFLQLVGEDMAQLKGLVPAVTGSCEDFRQAARRRGRLLPSGTHPLPGDIILVIDVATDHAHHACLAGQPRVPEGAEVPTVEGNSNDTGGSNGDGTYERNKRFGPNDPAVHGGRNRYELVRLTDPTIPCPEWLS